MNIHLQRYFHSFHVPASFWKMVAIEIFFFSSMMAIFWQFALFLERKALAMTGAQGLADLERLVAINPERALELLTQLRSFLIAGLLLFCILLIASFLWCSLSQALVWHTLLKQKVRYWRWNGLQLALLIPFFLFTFVFGVIVSVVYLLMNGVVGLMSLPPSLAAILTGFFAIVSNSITLLLLLLFFVMIFLISYAFAHSFRVFISLGEGFHLLRMHLKKIWPGLLLMLATALVLTVVLMGFKSLVTSSLVIAGLNVVVFFGYLSWMRIYLLHLIEHGQ